MGYSSARRTWNTALSTQHPMTSPDLLGSSSLGSSSRFPFRKTNVARNTPRHPCHIFCPEAFWPPQTNTGEPCARVSARLTQVSHATHLGHCNFANAHPRGITVAAEAALRLKPRLPRTGAGHKLPQSLLRIVSQREFGCIPTSLGGIGWLFESSDDVHLILLRKVAGAARCKNLCSDS